MIKLFSKIFSSSVPAMAAICVIACTSENPIFTGTAEEPNQFAQGNDDSREKGYMTMLSDFIKEQVSCDFSIGFSSEKLFKTVYKSKNCLQIYYRYEFTSDCVLQNVEPQELNIHPFALNPYTFRIIANDEYVHYFGS